MNSYAYDIRHLDPPLLPIPNESANHSSFNYHQDNQVKIQHFTKYGDNQSSQIERLKGRTYDAPQLLETTILYSTKIEKDLFLNGSSLNLLNGKIYYGDDSLEINLAALYVIYLERSLKLSNGFKALLEESSPSVQRVFLFFSRADVQDDIKLHLYIALSKQKANKRTKESIASAVEKEAARLFSAKISYAYNAGIFADADIMFWMQFMTSFPVWKKARDEASTLEKILPVKPGIYKPWLIIIRRQLLKVATNNAIAPQDPKILKYVKCVMKWLTKSNHRNLILWLMKFLFNEECTDTKRPYLYLHGEPNSGKTYFMDVLTPSSEEGFSIKHRTFSHFGPDKAGEYELNLLLFDDPGEAKGKMNQIDSSLILNLANGNLKHSLPVKFGFMTFKKGQTAIISNRPASELFAAESISAMNTRLLPIEITLKDPFPLRGHSLMSNEVTFHHMQEEEEAAEEKDFAGAEREQPSILNFLENDLHDDDHEENHNEFLEKGIIFYVLWSAIFRVIECQLPEQSASSFKSIVPNAKFREIIKHSECSLFELICKRLSEPNLLKLLEKS